MRKKYKGFYMDKNNYIVRINKIKEAMAEKDIDVFLIGPSSNLFYLTGYGMEGDERLLLLVLPREGGSGASSANSGAFVLANLLYKEQVKSLPVNDFVYWKDGEDPFALLKSEIEKRKIKLSRAALEPKIPSLFSLPISRLFPGAEFELGTQLTDPLRQFKDESELELIRRACRKSDEALAAVIDRGSYWIGKT